ncbi:MAG: secretion system protein E, partial [Halanaeroarchaeum sp.]
MAIDDAEGAESSETESPESGRSTRDAGDGPGVRRGEYSWTDFFEEYEDVPDLDEILEATGEGDPPSVDWEAVPFDPEDEFGFHPRRTTRTLIAAASAGKTVQSIFERILDTTPVRKGEYRWEHYKREYYYLPDGSRPRDDDGEIVPFDKREHLGFDPDSLPNRLSLGHENAAALDDLVETRTVDVAPELDEEAFFSTVDGQSTIVSRYDLEKAVAMEKKRHFKEVERYWVNKPYAFVVIFHSEKENEKKYYLVEPHLTPVERELREFLTEKLRMAIKYAESDVAVEGTSDERREVIERETRKLLRRYDLYTGRVSEQRGMLERLMDVVDGHRLMDAIDGDDDGYASRVASYVTERGWYTPPTTDRTQADIEGMSVRPEPALVEEDARTLTQYQVEK